jgi:hypothetical protein
MASSQVMRRIEAWEAAGLIDPETARRLRETEGNSLPEPESAVPHPSTTGRAPGVTAVELFIYLGAAFVLGAWYALVASTIPSGEGYSARFGVAGLIAGIMLGIAGTAMARRDTRFRRAAGVAFLAALPNLGVGVYLIADTLHPDTYPAPPTDALVASIVVLAAALVGRRVLPALTTQLGLAISVATAGLFAMGWLDAVLFPRGGQEWDSRPLDETAALVRVVLSVTWWWAVAAVMAVLLVILDPEPRTEGRTRLGRVAVGLTAVLGTTSAVVIRHDWSETSAQSGQPVLEPFVGAMIILAVSGLLLALAVKRASVGYLWPGGLGVFIALTWLNAEYLAVESGLWIALLVEAVVLFGVAFGVSKMGRRLQGGKEGPAEG